MNVEEEINKLVQWKARMESVMRPLPGVLQITGNLMLHDTLVADWIDYSALSTIVGWSSFTTKVIQYARVGRLVTVLYNLAGTSDNTAASFTLPYTAVGTFPVIGRAQDNGGTFVNNYGRILANNTMVLFPTVAGGTWTATGTKAATGQFSFMATQ